MRGRHHRAGVAALAVVALCLGAPAIAGSTPSDEVPEHDADGSETTDDTDPGIVCPPEAEEPTGESITTTTSTTTTSSVPADGSTTTTIPFECLPPCDETADSDGSGPDATAPPTSPSTSVQPDPVRDGEETTPAPVCRPVDPDAEGAATPGDTAPVLAADAATTADPEPATTTSLAQVTDPAASTDPTPEGEAAPVESPPAPDPEPELPSAALPAEPEGGWPIRTIRFPVHGPVRFDDDWGACRGGAGCPRRHIGNDVIGARLQPLVAAATGTVTHIVDGHRTAGYGLVITDQDGWEYRYYHVNNDTPGTDDGADDGTWRFVTGLAEGTAVSAGQVVAFMGDSGNSEGSVPHLHFEIHRPDGTPIDPYRSLLAAEWSARCMAASDPYRDALVPVPYPDSATTAAPIEFGAGRFLVGPDGSWASIGDARRSGDDRHAAGAPACSDVALPDPPTANPG